MIKHFAWLVPLLVTMFFSIGGIAYTGGTKIENHEQRITTLEENQRTLSRIETKVDSLLRR
jgi:hypothetical protein